MDVLRAHGTAYIPFQPHIFSKPRAVNESNGIFQVRPHKDFTSHKGRERVLSLRLLSKLPLDESTAANTAGTSSDIESRKAYDFMRRRKDATGDPMMQKWNASIRLANYASIEASPLCVGSTSQFWI